MIKSVFTLIALTTILLTINAQDATVDQAEIKVTESHDQTDACYDIQLYYNGAHTTLGSQNYRLFYDASVMRLREGSERLYLPENQYTLSIVQHKAGVDAGGVGALEFEKELGFINSTIIFGDPRYEGFAMSETSGWQSVVQFCFDPIEDQTGSPKIVLGRKSLTREYGRAFVELSAVDAKGATYSLPISSYLDLGR